MLQAQTEQTASTSGDLVEAVGLRVSFIAEVHSMIAVLRSYSEATNE